MATFTSSLPVLNGSVFRTLTNFRSKTATPTFYLQLKCGLLFVHEEVNQPYETTHVLAGAITSKGIYPNSVRIQSEGRTLIRFVCKSSAEHAAWMYALKASSNWTLDSHYERTRTIAVGQNGTVLEVLRKSTGVRYSVKCVPHDRVGLYELPIATSNDHERVIGAMEVMHHSAETYVVFPLMNDTLRNMIPLSEQDTKTLARQLLQGIDYLHGRGIVHRDLTPRNVLRTNDGNWMIADFGNAHMAQRGEKIRSIDSGMIISPHYTAPELLQLDAHDGETDLWSIGVLIFEALSGRKPFDGETYDEVERKVTNCEFDMIGDEWDLVSNDAKDFVWDLLDVEPDNRLDVQQALKHSWLKRNEN